MALAATCLSLADLPAQAYHLSGCVHYSTTVNYKNGGGGTRDYEAIFDQSAADWSATPTPLWLAKTTDLALAHLLIDNYDFGNTGYDGVTYANRSCPGTWTIWPNAPRSYVNDYYALGEPSSKVKSIVAHEIGHALGLNHQSTSLGCPYVPIMFPITTTRYDLCGKTTPQADDIAGINAIY